MTEAEQLIFLIFLEYERLKDEEFYEGTRWDEDQKQKLERRKRM